MAELDTRPEGFQRVSAALAACAHPHRPLWLDVAARTAQEAADALGVTLGQIAKSVVFRRKADDVAWGNRRIVDDDAGGLCPGLACGARYVIERRSGELGDGGDIVEERNQT